MPTLLTARLPHVSGFVADTVQNSFVVGHLGAPTAEQRALMTSAIVNFYNAFSAPAEVSVGAWIGPQISRVANACEVRHYDISDHLDGSPHGSPLRTDLWTLQALSGAPVALPSEVACAVTLEGVGRAGQAVELAGPAPRVRPKSRRTGKIYAGPFHTGVLSGNPARPSATLQTTLLTAVDKLDEAFKVIDPAWYLGVWSRANSSIYELSRISVDNAFDTQRRRGEKATVRTRIAANVALAA